MEFILWPLAARGVNSDGKRLSLCSLRCGRICSPAAEMSAPESGSTWVRQEPLGVMICIVMVGAGSMVTYLTLMVVSVGVVYSTGSWSISSVVTMALAAGGFCCGCRLWQTLAKRPTLRQWRQVCLKAGHCARPP